MPSVVWTRGADSLTFPNGIVAGVTHQAMMAGVLSDRLAGGAIVTYDLGLSDMESLAYEFPHLTQALLDAALVWKNTTVRNMLRTFTHTDNSKSPAYVATVRLNEFAYTEEYYASPSAPRYRLRVTLQVEPT
ncbi:hypothetical protein [Nitrospira sp. Nam74]